jgi:hypothetical protein
MGSQQTGFTDTVPVLREATVKAIGLLSDKVRHDRFLRLCTATHTRASLLSVS